MGLSRYVRLARHDPEWFARRVAEKAELRRAQLAAKARHGAQEAVRAAAARSGVTRLATRGPLAEAEHLSVMDGWTLNLYAAVPPDAAGPAELVLTRYGAQLRAPADLSGGRVTATALLGAEYGGLAITPGTWRVAVEVATPAGGRRTLQVLSPAAGAAGKGPTRHAGGRAETGLAITAATSPTGFARLTVARLPVTAEVREVRMGWDSVEVHGVLVGAGIGGALTACFRSGRGDLAHEAPVAVAGTAFRVAVPLARLSGGKAERIWELQLTPAGHPPVRAGRTLTDLADPRRALRLPQRTVKTESGPLVRIRPHYTATGALALGCARVAASFGA